MVDAKAPERRSRRVTLTVDGSHVSTKSNVPTSGLSVPKEIIPPPLPALGSYYQVLAADGEVLFTAATHEPFSHRAESFSQLRNVEAEPNAKHDRGRSQPGAKGRPSVGIGQFETAEGPSLIEFYIPDDDRARFIRVRSTRLVVVSPSQRRIETIEVTSEL